MAVTNWKPALTPTLISLRVTLHTLVSLRERDALQGGDGPVDEVSGSTLSD
jgi:hypothetical protein